MEAHARVPPLLLLTNLLTTLVVLTYHYYYLHGVPEEEEARVPVGQEEAREVQYQPLGGVQLIDALHTLLARVKAKG